MILRMIFYEGDIYFYNVKNIILTDIMSLRCSWHR